MKRFPNYIEHNLKEFGNCYLPNWLVEECKTGKVLKQVILEQTGYKVRVKRYKLKKFGDDTTGKFSFAFKNNTYIYDYIAEVIK